MAILDGIAGLRPADRSSSPSPVAGAGGEEKGWVCRFVTHPPQPCSSCGVGASEPGCLWRGCIASSKLCLNRMARQPEWSAALLPIAPKGACLSTGSCPACRPGCLARSRELRRGSELSPTETLKPSGIPSPRGGRGKPAASSPVPTGGAWGVPVLAGALIRAILPSPGSGAGSDRGEGRMRGLVE